MGNRAAHCKPGRIEGLVLHLSFDEADMPCTGGCLVLLHADGGGLAETASSHG